MNTGQAPETSWPRMVRLRRKFPASEPVEVAEVVRRGFQQSRMLEGLRAKARVGVCIGSRGIAQLQTVVNAVLEVVQRAGLDPFIIPAMGSHGGGTPDGQLAMLDSLGVGPSVFPVPFEAGLEVEKLGQTADGVAVWTASAARRADGLILVNRIKPHTDFGGALGSGLVKMLVVGLGKAVGAAMFHGAAARCEPDQLLREMAQVALAQLPVLAGVALVEDAHHALCRVEVLPPDQWLETEPRLIEQARRLMPRLPLEDIDLLIVDRFGKDISGTGMDANVIGRHVRGYLSSLKREPSLRPHIRRLFVRDLSPASRGNALGIGLADFTTRRVVEAMDRASTYANALTALSIQAAKVPLYFDTDREAIAQALASLRLEDLSQARVMRIRDTLSLTALEVSEACLPEIEADPTVEVLSPPAPFVFDGEGNLVPLEET